MSPIQILSHPKMGRTIVDHDPKNRRFMARGALFNDDAQIVSKFWERTGKPYNQGNTSSCVGQSIKSILNSTPQRGGLSNTIKNKPAEWFYEGAQDWDDWAGTDYDGTSAKGACEFLLHTAVNPAEQQRLDDYGINSGVETIIKEYRWCFGIQDVKKTLAQHGSVTVGIMWTGDMMSTDSEGFVHPSGEDMGGHQIHVQAINVVDEYFTFLQSWGTDWGNNGKGRISFKDMANRLNAGGDAVTIVR